MTRVLVLYASTHGHTAKIARRIAEPVRGAGLEPELQEARAASGVSPRDYDYTDWDAVERFGRDFAREVAKA